MKRITISFIAFFSLCTYSATFIQTLNLSDLSSFDVCDITFSSSLKSIIDYTEILYFSLSTPYKDHLNCISCNGSGFDLLNYSFSNFYISIDNYYSSVCVFEK
jgi:hypothetical protein